MYAKDLTCANNAVTTTITIITTSPKRMYLNLMLQLHGMDDRAMFYRMAQVNQCTTTITSRVHRITITIITHLEASHKGQ
jgi:hypothetical protein